MPDLKIATQTVLEGVLSQELGLSVGESGTGECVLLPQLSLVPLLSLQSQALS